MGSPFRLSAALVLLVLLILVLLILVLLILVSVILLILVLILFSHNSYLLFYIRQLPYIVFPLF